MRLLALLERLRANLCHTGHTMILLLMGVSGAGKTTVGKLLAEELGWSFYDADTFHPPANVAKMSDGVPLSDADRLPWLNGMHAKMAEVTRRGDAAVFTSSALKAAYRDILSEGDADPHFVYLKGSYDLLKERLENRAGHFFKAELLQSQLDALEEPDDALTLDIRLSPEALVAEIRRAFDLGRA